MNAMDHKGTKITKCAEQLRPSGGRVQAPLPMRIPGLVPLATMETARGVLAPFCQDEEDIRAAIDSGEIQWAFNISSGKEVREVRIYFPCIEQRLALLQNPKWKVRTFLFDQVLASLFPRGVLAGRVQSLWVTTPEVARAFNCESDTVLSLVRSFRTGNAASGLRLLPGTNIRAGGFAGSGAAVIDFKSVQEFLERRTI